MRSIKFYSFLAAFSSLLLVTQPQICFAQNATPEQAQQDPAGKFVQDLGNKAISIMADQSETQDQRTTKYKKILQDSFDMPTIAHFVLGRAWNTATPDQQKQFTDLFEQLILQTYGNHLNFYSGEKFQVTAAHQEGDKDTIVSSTIAHPGDQPPPTKIDWRVRNNNGKQAILDVVIEGVSQSVTERQEYASILQSNNNNIDALIASLRQRVQGAPAQ